MSDTSEVNEIEAKVISRLKKTVTIKKELSAKQQAHLDKLSNSKKGKKYTEVVEAKDVELPVEIKAKVKKPKEVSEVKAKVKKPKEVELPVEVKKVKKVKKQVIVYESSSESESEPDTTLIIKKKPKVAPQERLFMIC